MKQIASRRPGRRRLVYDKVTKAIVEVDRAGNKTGCILETSEDEANFI